MIFDRLTILIRTCKAREARAQKTALILKEVWSLDVRVVLCTEQHYYSEDFLFKLSREANSVKDFVLVIEDDIIFSKQATDFLAYLQNKRFDFVWCTLENPKVLTHSVGKDLYGLHLVRCERLAYSGAIFYSKSVLQTLCEHALLTHLNYKIWRYDLQFSNLAQKLFGGVIWVSGEHFATEPKIVSVVEYADWINVDRNSSQNIDFYFDFTNVFDKLVH